MKKFLCFLILSAPFFLQAAEPDYGKTFYMDYIKGLLHVSDKKYDKALDHFEKNLKEFPESEFLKTLILQTAIAAGKEDNYEEIAKEVSQYKDKNSLIASAAYSWSKGHLKDALSYYESALALDPENTAILAQYLTLLNGMDSERAVAFLEEYAEKVPELAAVIFQEAGNVNLKRGRTEDALTMYFKATKANPRYAEAYISRAEIYQKQSKLQESLKEYKKLEDMGLADTYVYLRIGTLHVLLKNIPEARKYFEKILSYDPSSILANQFMAAISEDEKNYAAALKYLQAAGDYKTNASKLLQASFYAARMGNAEEASSILDNAYKVSDKSVEVGYFYAVSLQDLGKHKEAVKIFKEILSQTPQYEKARMMYGVSLDALGDNAELEKQMRIVVGQNPANSEALNSLAYALLEQNKKLKEAKKHIDRSLQLKPDDYATIDSLGWYYYKTKDYDKALEYFEKALSKMPDDKVIAGHKGLALYRLGRYKEALPWIIKAEDKKLNKYIKKAEKKSGE
ncbi:Tetratricopeptide repeat protein [Elusimicrobium minutum Pei191]|uniref:Tetratricopeptide repeat protein n=1 Tax=Elusimicrobium minutum (strain Pei191) TaxID=445932 RepID=B2KDW0_ELUMP|nr:tetratricopeptide repeat protein [Elusimicrobium minutum]ACC98706.1 Tetratricopeptide repeat protein [Elusimicrobium minutum Pei191]